MTTTVQFAAWERGKIDKEASDMTSVDINKLTESFEAVSGVAEEEQVVVVHETVISLHR